MRWMLFLVSVVVLTITGLFGNALAPQGVRAQESTPAAEEGGLPQGITFDALAFGAVAELPAVPGFAVIERGTFAPGAVLPGEPGDASSGAFTFLYVESGSLTVEVDQAMSVTRGTAIADALTTGAFPPAQEDVAAGTEVVLEAGDSVIFPPSSGGGFRNDGTVPAVVLVVNIMSL